MSKPPLHAVMFDLDGTLLDTAPDLIAALNRLRVEHQLPELPAALIRPSVSNGARALVELGFGVTDSDASYESLRQRLLDLYMLDVARYSTLFPGLDALLLQLQAQGIGWGIATNKPALYTEALLAQLQLEPAPALVICPDHVSRRKPDPESLILAARHFGCEPMHMAYVGDHLRDIECGRLAGATTIACAYGYIEEGDSIDSWQADYIVERGDQIWPLLVQHFAVNTVATNIIQ
ncbi:MAG TPA: HAD-IA family hydrolase [Cellvibrionaceae bacterium]